MEPPGSILEDDEWELCDDDGFVYSYKRKKRRLVPPPTAVDKGTTNPEEEGKHRREWKRRSLLKVAKRYKREIGQWEILSNALKAMQEKAQRCQIEQQQRQEIRERREEDSSVSGSGLPSEDRDGGAYGCVIDELLAQQAEAQEDIIWDISNLCEVAEAMCDVQEEQLKKIIF